jgi:multidrug transporter EmrE-like cation transporter
MKTLIILLIAGLVLTVGDLVAGEWVQKNKKTFFGKRFSIFKKSQKASLYYWLALVFYMIGLNFLIYSYKFEDIAVASVIMEIFNIVSLTIAGKFLFKENISKTEFAGIVVGVFAVIILEFA